MNKKISFLKAVNGPLIFGIMAVFLVLLFAGCGEETTTSTTSTTPVTTPTSPTTATVLRGAYKANLTGSAEVPPVNTQATGQAAFTPMADEPVMTFTITVSNINDVSAAHIHLAGAGSNGPIVVTLAGAKQGAVNGTLVEGTFTAADLQGPLAGKTLEDLVTELMAGNAYVNVHTATNPNGEIRGQISY